MKNTNIYIPLIFILSLIGISTLEANVDFQIKAPNKIVAGESFIVEVSISKSNINGFSKFETVFPYSFEIEGVKCTESTFIYKDNKAKFIWVDLPTSSDFTVSYKVKIPGNFKGELKLENHFHYVLDKEKKSIKKEISLNILNEGTNVTENPNTILYKDQKSIRKRILFDLRFNLKQPVVYRVQLAAFSNPNVPQEFLDELCEEEFRLKSENNDGLVKYYVGNFYSFEAAEMFQKYSGVKDAFIIALKNGERITIEEAKKLQEKE